MNTSPLPTPTERLRRAYYHRIAPDAHHGFKLRHVNPATGASPMPSWHALQWQAQATIVLFSYSDRPVQQALGLWSEEKT